MEALEAGKYLSELWSRKMFTKEPETIWKHSGLGVLLRKLGIGQDSFKYFQGEHGNLQKQKCNYPAEIFACLWYLFYEGFRISG